MASLIREWVGINTFASATQTKLLELLGKLKQEVLFLRPIFTLLTMCLLAGVYLIVSLGLDTYGVYSF